MRGNHRYIRFAAASLAAAALAVGLMAMTHPSSLPPRDVQPRAEPMWQALIIGGAEVRWPRSQGGGAPVLRYAFATARSDDPGAVNCRAIGPLAHLARGSRLSEAQLRSAAAEAFSRWQDVADITFLPAADAASADIVIGAEIESTGHAYTDVRIGTALAQGARAIEHATICLNPAQAWKIGFDGNLATFDLVHTLTHEIGHAIGLDHPGARGALMAFRYDESRIGLADGDIRGAAAIYGARLSRR